MEGAEVVAQVPPSVSASMLALARRIVSNHMAEDVVQDVMARLYTAPHRFDPARGSLSSFLLTSTRSRAIDLLRAETARGRREERHFAWAEVVPPIEALVTDRDQGDRIVAALELLPVAERDAITLAYFGGLTYTEVAEHLGIPDGTAKSRIRAGLARMRTILEALDLDG